MAKKKVEGEDEQGSGKPQTKIRTNIEQTGLVQASLTKKNKLSPAIPQAADVFLRATESHKFREAGDEFYATQIIADKLIDSNQAEPIAKESEEEHEE